MNTSAQPLQPEEGAINTIVGERPVKDLDDATTKGKATMFAAAHLARDIGAAVMSLAMENRGTLEIQLTVEKERDALAGITVHKWRVDVWKARQRQYLRVPVQDCESAMAKGEKTPDLTLPDGSRPGVFHCPNCREERWVAIKDMRKPFPRRTAYTCPSCKLPIFLQFVEAKG